jgi:hypothetical protein
MNVIEHLVTDSRSRKKSTKNSDSTNYENIHQCNHKHHHHDNGDIHQCNHKHHHHYDNNIYLYDVMLYPQYIYESPPKLIAPPSIYPDNHVIRSREKSSRSIYDEDSADRMPTENDKKHTESVCNDIIIINDFVSILLMTIYCIILLSMFCLLIYVARIV